jgi:hypothetical protein
MSRQPDGWDLFGVDTGKLSPIVLKKLSCRFSRVAIVADQVIPETKFEAGEGLVARQVFIKGDVILPGRGQLVPTTGRYNLNRAHTLALHVGTECVLDGRAGFVLTEEWIVDGFSWTADKELKSLDHESVELDFSPWCVVDMTNDLAYCGTTTTLETYTAREKKFNNCVIMPAFTSTTGDRLALVGMDLVATTDIRMGTPLGTGYGFEWWLGIDDRWRHRCFFDYPVSERAVCAVEIGLWEVNGICGGISKCSGVSKGSGAEIVSVKTFTGRDWYMCKRCMQQRRTNADNPNSIYAECIFPTPVRAPRKRGRASQ